MAQVPAGTKFLGVDPNFTDLKERKGTKVDRQTEYFSLEDITATVGVGSEGPQGIQGPAGPPGPVGPAGLEWQGAWDTNSSYAVNDAVGFNGASWFCISEVTGTGNSNPEEDTVSWALLAAQGATGPQGAQGPTGPQGPQGEPGGFSYTEGSLNADSSSFVEFTKLEQNFTRVYVSSPTDNYIGISNIGLDTGHIYVVQNKSTVNDLIVRPIDNVKFLQPNGFDSQSDFTVKANTYARFTLVDNTSGSDKVFMVEIINPLGLPSLPYKTYRAILNQTGTSAPVATVLENTVGNIVWTRNSPGNYSATLVGTFLANKTYYPTFGTSNSFNRVYTNRLNDDVMTIISISEDFSTYLDNELFNFPIEILVYN